MSGWSYKLWGNQDITKKNFPITYDYIQKIIKIGNELNIINKKYAQIADLMRLEILYNQGGVYIDTTAECLKNFDKLFNNIDYTFVVSNEDPCGFDCISNDRHYVSNSFIASTKKNPILKKILEKRNLNKIDLYSSKVNIETGPFFLGENLHKLKHDYKISMLPTNLIYPHGYKNEYRSRNQNDKCFKYKKAKNTNIELTNKHDEHVYLEYPCKSYPNSYVIKHWEAGGSWN